MVKASNLLLSMLWLTCTLIGFWNGRRRRFDDHRRWMIRSLVLTMSIITNRVWAVIFIITLAPQVPTTFGGNETLFVQTIAGLSAWLGWTLPLLVAEWWLIDKVARRPAASFAPSL